MDCVAAAVYSLLHFPIGHTTVYKAFPLEWPV